MRTLILGNVYGSQQSMGGMYENYPGFPEGILGLELSERMLAQAKRYGAEHKQEQVQKVVSLEGVFLIKTESWEYQGRALILATGASHRSLGVPGEDKLVTRGVSYCVYCDGALFRDRVAAVVGYGNGAARAALYLANICSKVHLVCTQEKLVAEAVYLDRLKELSNLGMIAGAEVNRILGDEFVAGVEFTVGGTVRSLKVDGVFVEVGVSPNVELAVDIGLAMTKGGFINVNRLTQETSLSGIFAAGDVTGGRMQVTTAVGSGTSAAISAMRYLK